MDQSAERGGFERAEYVKTLTGQLDRIWRWMNRHQIECGIEWLQCSGLSGRYTCAMLCSQQRNVKIVYADNW